MEVNVKIHTPADFTPSKRTSIVYCMWGWTGPRISFEM